MRYTVRVSYVDILGRIWMPNTVASLRQKLSSYDIENARNENGELTRESVEQWLMTHSGDFREIIDWRGSIEDDRTNTTVDFDWEHGEDSEIQYSDTLGEGNE